jgi:hypothetical protein
VLHLQYWGRVSVAVLAVAQAGGVNNRGAVPDWAKIFLFSKVSKVPPRIATIKYYTVLLFQSAISQQSYLLQCHQSIRTFSTSCFKILLAMIEHSRFLSSFFVFVTSCFHRGRSLALRPTPTWKTRVPLLIWAITFDLSGKGDPTSGKLPSA